MTDNIHGGPRWNEGLSDDALERLRQMAIEMGQEPNYIQPNG